MTTLIVLAAYVGNASFAARKAAWFSGASRFFVRPNGWADMAVAPTKEQAIQLLELGALQPGGTAGTRLQIKWVPEALAILGFEFPGMPVEIKGARGANKAGLLEIYELIAASK